MTTTTLDQSKVNALAGALADVLHDWLSEAEWYEMKRRNATYGEGICASHDFCDANMAMEQAFRETFGRGPLDGDNGMSDEDVAYWNAAWDVAKSGWLTA